MMPVKSYNEWDPLEEVFIGNAFNAHIPNDRSFQIMQRSSPDLFDSLKSGTIPERIIAETEEDIQIFIEHLQRLNIVVKRPKPLNKSQMEFKTLNWQTTSFFPYCPRDTLLVIGDWIIETPNVLRARYFETMMYKDNLIAYLQQGAKWISAPKPRLDDLVYNHNNPNMSALLNHEPVFDAANILRAGRDLFFLISDSGNELGCQWLQQILAPTYRVHPCRNLYSSLHIDSTISLLRPGLALINPSRVNKSNLPPLLRQWECLPAPEMIEYQYSNFGNFSTKWLGMNLFMLAADLAVVDSHQKPLIKLLEKKQINVLPLRLRHGRTLGGGFHCITLDIRRSGELQCYFD